MPQDKSEEAWLKRFYIAWYPFASRSSAQLKRWSDLVRSLEVSLHPGGRAEVRHTEEPYEWEGEAEDAAPGWVAEIRWRQDHGTPVITSFRLDSGSDPSLPWANIDMAAYVAAVYLAIDAAKKRTRAKKANPPSPGQPASVGFYRNLIDEYDRLKAEAHPAPAQELARQRGVPVGTVKSWLSRGRKYLKESEGED